MNIRPFKATDFQQIRLQPAQVELGAFLTDDMMETLEGGDAFTAELRGRVIGAAGVAPIWEGRAAAWALLSVHIGPHFLQVHRAALRYLQVTPYRRIEATAAAAFDDGRRWLELLGFKLETPEPMRAYLPSGDDAFQYAWVRA